jgi:hypothetical protein
MKVFIICFIIACSIFSIITINLMADSRESSRKIIEESNLINEKTMQINKHLKEKNNGMKRLLQDPGNILERNNIFEANAKISTNFKFIRNMTENKELKNKIDNINEIQDKKINIIENELLKIVKSSPVTAKKLFQEKYLPASTQQANLIADFTKNVFTNKSNLLEKTQGKFSWVLNLSYLFLLIMISVFYRF